jgi:hypothetical protein
MSELNRVQFENHDSVCPTVTRIKERNYDFQTRRGLEEAIQVLEDAFYSAPLDSLVRADRLSGLANALRIRWLRQRNGEDLERVHLLYEEAVR